MNDSTVVKIINLSLNYSKPAISLESDWIVLSGVLILIVIGYFITRKLRDNNFPLVEMEIEISGAPKAIFKVKRDDSNIYIANRIYIELITRKAAIPIDENNDVIYEIYISWYKLFGIIRDEVKNVPGHYLRSHNPSAALIGLSIKILNDGLRPHLTKYQAGFKKWFEEEIKKDTSKSMSPQDIQSKYIDYRELVDDMKVVNQILIDYSIQLEKLIKGNF